MLKALYDTDEDFREYVDNYRNHYIQGTKLTLEEALSHKIVACYAEWLIRNR